MSSYYKTKKSTKRNRKSPGKGKGDHIKLYDSPSTLPLIRSSENKVFTIVQTTNDYTLAQAAITPSFLSFNFSLDQLPQYTSWTAVFDQYKFDQVQVIIRPMYNAVGLASLSTVRVPQLFTVIDYDDNATPSTLAQLQEYSNCKIAVQETTCCTFAPHMAVAAYSGSAFTDFANLAPSWIDAASPDVKHYGVKMGCDPGVSGQTLLQAWNVSVRYQISFRNIR